MKTILHTSINIKGMLLLPNRDLDVMVKMKEEGFHSVEEKRAYLQGLYDAGHRYICMTKDCYNFDPVTGCPGHTEEEMENYKMSTGHA